MLYLYKDVYTSNGEIPPKDRPKALGVLYREPIETAFKKIDAEGRSQYKDFAKVAVTSLLIGDWDLHTGNIGVVTRAESREKKLVRIDFGAAFEKLTPKVHPYSFMRHLPGMGPANHFRSYPEALRISAEFVEELDRVAKLDYYTILENTFNELKQILFYKYPSGPHTLLIASAL